jgi:hypothetical protein
MVDSVVVTGSDAKYFRYARDTLRSLQALRLGGIGLALLDFGLDAEQCAWLAAERIVRVPVGWDIQPGNRDGEVQRMGDGYKAMTSRPFLPRYFPDAKVIQWIDADAWVQSPEGVTVPMEAARRHGFAIVPELHRAYAHLYSGGQATQAMHRNATLASFGEGIANVLAANPILNSGLFAGRHDSPVWAKWQEFAAAGIANSANKYTEQIALNLACYTVLGRSDADTVQFLPPEYNFCCGLALPKLDRDGKQVLDPKYPHDPVHVVHLVGMNQRREFATPDGGTVETSLVYSDLHGA